MVYLIHSKSTDLYKIGCSANPYNRLRNLQNGLKEDLELLRTLEGGYTLEKHLHSLFKDFRVNGEWFIKSPEILNYFDGNDVDIFFSEGDIEMNKEGYCNATSFCNYFNQKKNKSKKISEYLRIKATLDFIDYLNQEMKINPYTSTNKGTWMHPILFLDFCMWLDITLKVLIDKISLSIKISETQLIMNNAITDNYINQYGCKPAPMIYINEAKTINAIAGVLGKERNEMTESELNKITILQKVNTTLIKDGVGKESRKKQLNIIARSL